MALLATVLTITAWIVCGLILTGIAWGLWWILASEWAELATFDDEETRPARNSSEGGFASEQGGRAGTDHGRTHDERSARL